MSESALTTLKRWEESGAAWRVLELGEDHALVELRSCLGEPVDELRVGPDHETLRYLAERRSSGA